MKSVNDWLHAMLKSHVLPDEKVTKQHKPLVELRMNQMEELLPSVNKLFEEVKVEMAGSVQSNSKVSIMLVQSKSLGLSTLSRVPNRSPYAFILFWLFSPACVSYLGQCV